MWTTLHATCDDTNRKICSTKKWSSPLGGSMRRKLIALLALLVTHSAASAAVTSEELLGEGIQLLSEDRWADSIVVLQQAAAHANSSDAAIDAALAMAYHELALFDFARHHYERSLAVRPRYVPTIINVGKLFLDMMDHANALPYFERAVALNPKAMPGVAHYMALCYHHTGNYIAAERAYYQVPQDEQDSSYHFDFGVTLDRLGKILEAADHFNEAIGMNPSDPRPWLNIAALHQIHGRPEDAIRNLKQALSIPTIAHELRTMAMTNLGIAYEHEYDIRMAMHWYQAALKLVPYNQTANRLGLSFHIFRARRTACFWEDLEDRSEWLVDQVIEKQLRRGVASALLPFDTLLMPMDPQRRLFITNAHAQLIATRSASYRQDDEPLEPHPSAPNKVCVAYMSYDFNDHPTAHLMEGLFAFHDHESVDVVAYGYGKDDGSGFRKRLVALVGDFVNLAIASVQESIRTVKERGVEILMDAQVHTRGSRILIPAARPAPIVVNYLVYPGTSGAPFVDYLVADRFVTPPEILASHFSEKLVLLPYSYQVNYYPQAIVPGGRASLWAPQEDTTKASEHGWFTFINFNKVDKLEPRAFSLWMAILRRVPKSRLLLLEPATRPETTKTSPTTLAIKQNILAEALARGIAPDRVQFVPRLLKHNHLMRHRIGSLFLDTFVYAAHSTATDALYAGVPVLTLAGDAFASRVGVSLLTNAGVPELITHSLREFEELAVSIALQPPLLRRFQERLRNEIPPLFRTKEHVEKLEEAQRVMAMLYRQSVVSVTPMSMRTAHIVVT